MGSFNGFPARASRPAAPAATDSRTRLVRAIHAAARKQALGDEARHDLQVGVTGKASLTDMTQVELRQVLARLNRDGGPAPNRPHVSKVRALWWSLYWLGVIDSADDKPLDVFVRRQAGVDALRFLDHRQAFRVIEALKAWLAREGVEWPQQGDEHADRWAVMAAIDAELVARGLVPASPASGSSSADLDAAIRSAGKRLRDARPAR